MYQNIIIIPYRNRENHLDYFLKNSVPLIEELMPETKVVVVEQSEGKLFNRGKVLNVGFKEYMDKTEYFITHDVDINPTKLCIEKSYNLKNENGIVTILTPHSESFGQIVKFHNECIKKTNGFPNYIWGWGIEDRALFFRCYLKKVNVKRTDNKQYNFKFLSHVNNAEYYAGEKKIISDKWQKSRIDKLNDKDKNNLLGESGLNTIEYKILERKELHKIVELIKVEI